MVQCSETKAMAKESTGTDPKKVGRVHVILGPEGKPEILELA